MTADEHHLQTRASEAQLENREKLLRLFRESPLPIEELLVNLPLYMRSSTVAKLLYVNELYELIVHRPGVVMEFGVWRGANLALFESLRAIHEPYNYARRIVGFDTFDGYPSVSPEDGADQLAKVGQYAVGETYVDHLRAVLDYHRLENPMSHLERFELLPGNAAETVSDYLSRHPETIVALAYFDMQLYEPTKCCLQAIRPYLTRGSVIAMDELNSREFPGETLAFREVFGLGRYQLERSRFLPDRTYLIVD